jgi:hypothetical protein
MALCFKQAKELGLPVGNRATISYPVTSKDGKVKGNAEVQIELTEDISVVVSTYAARPYSFHCLLLPSLSVQAVFGM